MKRADLKVGDELFYRRGKYGSGKKAVVVDTERYVERTGYFRDGPAYRKDPHGTLVLVDVVDEWSGTPRTTRTAVPLSSLHGPYEQAKAAEDAAAQAAAAADRAEADRVAVARSEVNRLVRQADSLGLKGIQRGDSNASVMAVSPATLARLLDAYGRVAREYADRES